MSGKSKYGRFVFRGAADAETNTRFAREGKFDEEFTKALWEAYKRNTKELCDLLRSPERNELPLTEDQLDKLATFIERRMPDLESKPPGHPAGNVVLTPKQDVRAMLIALARGQLERIRRRNGGKLPRGAIDKTIDEVATRLGDDGYSLGFEESESGSIRTAVKRKASAKHP